MTDPPATPDTDSSLFSEPLLVVRQEPEIVDSIPLHAILDQNGARAGSVANVGQRDLSTALRPDRLGQAAQAVDSPGRGLMAAFTMVSSTFRQVPYRSRCATRLA